MSNLDQVTYHRLADSNELILSQGAYTEYAFKPHHHIDLHIGLVISGVQAQKFNGNKVLLGPGRISVMPPGEVHDGVSYRNNAYQMNTFRIAPELIQNYFGDMFALSQLPDFNGSMIENKPMTQQLMCLFDLLKTNKEISTLPVEEQWINTLLPLLETLTKKDSTSIKGTLSEKHLQWVIEYCHENLSKKITLDQLSTISDLNRYQFLRRFEKSVGMTPHQWLMQLRLEHACTLLRTSNKSLVDIAAEVGFFDQSHFNRAFKNFYGVKPSMY